MTYKVTQKGFNGYYSIIFSRFSFFVKSISIPLQVCNSEQTSNSIFRFSRLISSKSSLKSILWETLYAYCMLS